MTYARFAINPDRAREFRDHSRGSEHDERQVTWTLLQAGLARAIPEQSVTAEVLEAHRGVVGAILSTLPEAPLSDNGRLRLPALWRFAERRGTTPDLLPPAVAARMRPALGPFAPEAQPIDLLAELLERIRPAEGDAPGRR